jgi:hypothetical protein
VVALVIAYGVIPVARRWGAREAQISAVRDRVGRLQTLIHDADRLAGEAGRRESEAAAFPVRVVRGRTPALAASSLQGMLQDIATRSQVSITRLDVASTPDSAAGPTMLPASLSAVADIYGLAELLTGLQYGPALLDVREVSVSTTSGLRGDLLQVALTVRAPFLVER